MYVCVYRDCLYTYGTRRWSDDVHARVRIYKSGILIVLPRVCWTACPGGYRRIRRAGQKRRAERGALFGGESVPERAARDPPRPVHGHGNHQQSHRHIRAVQRVVRQSRRVGLFTPSAVYGRVSDSVRTGTDDRCVRSRSVAVLQRAGVFRQSKNKKTQSCVRGEGSSSFNESIVRKRCRAGPRPNSQYRFNAAGSIHGQFRLSRAGRRRFVRPRNHWSFATSGTRRALITPNYVQYAPS